VRDACADAPAVLAAALTALGGLLGG
jgi:hypothetical protein